ncbi:hypothetical protein [Larkinella soli]|uniref:hypothetical protein n=1 Tax=Larkinella soli TaxID=1770527 RepID=UPI000FFC3419|nr:hypothetical protein [Larkinella soli]
MNAFRNAQLLWLGCLSLLTLFGSGCTRFYSRRSIQELDHVFTVNGRQSLYYSHRTKPAGVLTKRLGKPASGVLYVQNDTLFVEFVKTSLPPSDGNPATIDVSDSSLVFFANPKVKPVQVDEKSPWFQYHFTSFDTDIITVPFKYRFGQMGQSGELITSANAAVYLGFRYDQGFQRNVFYHRRQRSEVRSFSIGTGGFLGVTASQVRPFTTAGRYLDEYEGACLSYGVAAIFGYRAITVGLALGYDYLMDKNRAVWIYQNKPWLGITVGLNLN